jgi:hypothetical protein
MLSDVPSQANLSDRSRPPNSPHDPAQEMRYDLLASSRVHRPALLGRLRVAKLSIRIDDVVFERLAQRAAGSGQSITAMLRPLVEEAAGTGGGYVYTANDEILALLTELYAVAITGMSEHHPMTLARAIEHARTMLRARGLLVGDDLPTRAADQLSDGEAVI